jgi:predicted ATPase/DNA-binding winged helix-turn-helix (wHTH) protein
MTTGDELTNARTVLFGPFKLLPSLRRLERGGVPVALGGRALDILIVLTERPQQIVTKRELFDRVWPRLSVDESSLRGHISALRKALGDDGHSDERYVANVPGRGYCFVAPISTGAVEQTRALDSPNEARLPVHANSIVGREGAIARITEQLNAQRFVSIVGPGGVGKTTVAISVAKSLAARFEENVCFVDFGALNDPNLVPSALALKLGVMVTSGDPVPSLLSAIRDRQLLLLLDGCEPVVETVAALVESLFWNSPGLHILATTRESLRAEGECVFRLRPLDCPPDDSNLTLAELLAFPAARLFVERLSTRGPTSGLTEADVPAVAAICRRLDGIPLALELAAGRVDGYGIQGIASLLGSQLALHLPGKRTAIPRQRTLSATLDWSYNLLTETEQRTLRRLSVFVGTFSLEAAQSIAADDRNPEHEVVKTIESLLSKSLFAAVTNAPALHYRLSDTTRTYLSRILSESGEADAVSRRHAIHCCERLEQGEASRGPASSAGSHARQDFVADIRAALDWSFSPHGEPELAVRLAAAAASTFLDMSLLTECRDWMQRAVSAFPSDAAPGRHAMELWTSLAISRMYTEGNSEAAHDAFRKGLAIAEQLGDLGHQFRLLSGLHLFIARIGSFQEALEQAKSAEAVARRLGNTESMSLATAMLGTAHHLAGDQASAQVCCEAAHQRFSSDSNAFLLRFGYDNRTRALGALSRVYWLRGTPTKAVRIAGETIEHGRKIDHPVSFCIALMFSVSVFFWVGDLEKAEQLVRQLRAHSEKHTLTPYRAVAVGMSGRLMIGRGDRQAGVQRFRECLETLRAGRHHILAIPFMADLVENLTAMEAYDDALATIDAVVAQDELGGGSWYTPELLRVKGVLLGRLRPSRRREAEQLLLRSLDLSRSQSAIAWELRAATGLAGLLREEGRGQEATAIVKSVYERFTEGHDTPDLSAARQFI